MKGERADERFKEGLRGLEHNSDHQPKVAVGDERRTGEGVELELPRVGRSSMAATHKLFADTESAGKERFEDRFRKSLRFFEQQQWSAEGKKLLERMSEELLQQERLTEEAMRQLASRSPHGGQECSNFSNTGGVNEDMTSAAADADRDDGVGPRELLVDFRKEAPTPAGAYHLPQSNAGSLLPLSPPASPPGPQQLVELFRDKVDLVMGQEFGHVAGRTSTREDILAVCTLLGVGFAPPQVVKLMTVAASLEQQGGSLPTSLITAINDDSDSVSAADFVSTFRYMSRNLNGLKLDSIVAAVALSVTYEPGGAESLTAATNGFAADRDSLFDAVVDTIEAGEAAPAHGVTGSSDDSLPQPQGQQQRQHDRPLRAMRANEASAIEGLVAFSETPSGPGLRGAHNRGKAVDMRMQREQEVEDARAEAREHIEMLSRKLGFLRGSFEQIAEAAIQQGYSGAVAADQLAQLVEQNPLLTRVDILTSRACTRITRDCAPAEALIIALQSKASDVRRRAAESLSNASLRVGQGATGSNQLGGPPARPGSALPVTGPAAMLGAAGSQAGGLLGTGGRDDAEVSSFLPQRMERSQQQVPPSSSPPAMLLLQQQSQPPPVSGSQASRTPCWREASQTPSVFEEVDQPVSRGGSQQGTPLLTGPAVGGQNASSSTGVAGSGQLTPGGTAARQFAPPPYSPLLPLRARLRRSKVHMGCGWAGAWAVPGQRTASSVLGGQLATGAVRQGSSRACPFGVLAAGAEAVRVHIARGLQGVWNGAWQAAGCAQPPLPLAPLSGYPRQDRSQPLHLGVDRSMSTGHRPQDRAHQAQ